MVVGNADYIASGYILSVYFHEINILVLINILLFPLVHNINTLETYKIV